MAVEELMSNLTLTREDICHHTSPCETTEWLEVTISDAVTFHRAYYWLRDVRNQKAVFVDGVKDEDGRWDPGKFKFRFLCKHEFLLFVLKWS